MAMGRLEFAGQPGLNAQLATDSLDRELLAAAIFHETNRVRHQLGLTVLQWLEKLNEAAEIQSHIGVLSRPPSHTNPFRAIGTPLERVKYAGLMPERVAENIALIPVYDVAPAGEIGVSRDRQKTAYIDPETGRELKVHTYASYAALVVQAWMDSPGHRANITDPSVKYLGCSVYPKRGNYGEEMVFSVQVFYAPKGKKSLAVQAPELVSRDGWLINRHGG